MKELVKIVEEELIIVIFRVYIVIDVLFRVYIVEFFFMVVIFVNLNLYDFIKDFWLIDLNVRIFIFEF